MAMRGFCMVAEVVGMYVSIRVTAYFDEEKSGYNIPTDLSLRSIRGETCFIENICFVKELV